MSSAQISKKRHKLEGSLHLLGGALGSLSSCVLLQPLDLIKTRMQQELAPVTLFTTIRSALSAPLPSESTSSKTSLSNLRVVKAVRNVVQSDGVLGLWRGTAPTVMRNVPGSAIYFWSLNEIREALKTVRLPAKELNNTNVAKSLSTYHGSSKRLQPRGLNPDTINLIAGASARTFAGFILMPMSVIKTRYESNHYNYKTISAAVQSIYKSEGVKGLFRGFNATVLRDSPYAGLYLFFYERLRHAFGPWCHPLSPYHPITTAISGAVAGLTATIVTNPFDVVRTRMQVLPLQYTGFVQGSIKIWKEDGLTGFWTGMLPRLARKVIAAAITWTIYEEVMVLFDTRKQK